MTTRGSERDRIRAVVEGLSSAIQAKNIERTSSHYGHDVRDLNVSSAEDVAFCTSLNHMTGTKTDGEPVDLWFRATYGLRKIDGRWVIVHEHESVPFYMDGSYRAAVDLRP